MSTFRNMPVDFKARVVMRIATAIRTMVPDGATLSE